MRVKVKVKVIVMELMLVMLLMLMLVLVLMCPNRYHRVLVHITHGVGVYHRVRGPN